MTTSRPRAPRTGDNDPMAPERLLGRVLESVEVGESCWIWQRAQFASGHGSMSLRLPTGATSRMAHRVTYELAFGTLPPGLVLHHKCHTPACVNPFHLVALTPLDHAAAHNPKSAPDRDPGTCHQGHPLEGDNRMVKPDGRVRCRVCANERDKIRQRGLHDFSRGAHKTHCKYGHPWVPENIVTRDNGQSSCRLCKLRYPAAEGCGPVPWPIRKDQRQ
jgi:hypothetical protein